MIILSQQQLEAGAQALQRIVANRTGRGKSWEEIPETLRASYREEFKAAVEAAMKAGQ